MREDEDMFLPRKRLSAKKAKNKGFLQKSQRQGSGIARVASVYGGLISLLKDDKLGEGIAPASIMTELVVGDHVAIDTEYLPWRIVRLFPRQTELKRTRGEGGSRHRKQLQVIAANIEVAVIVSTAAQPDFDAELVDRYIILCRASSIEPIICLNKAELTPARHPALKLYRQQGVTVIETSTKTRLGIEELRHALRGKMAILLGKSGVGKSSLTNTFLPQADVKTQEINARAQQGQHTTTRSDIHVWEPDSFLIDTPGIRTLDVSHVDDDDIALGFPDILELAQKCRFSDCKHDEEPGCAVKQGLEDGKIADYRWESYQHITQK